MCWWCCYILLRVGQAHRHVEHRLADCICQATIDESCILRTHYIFQEFTEIKEGLRPKVPSDLTWTEAYNWERQGCTESPCAISTAIPEKPQSHLHV